MFKTFDDLTRLSRMLDEINHIKQYHIKKTVMFYLQCVTLYYNSNVNHCVMLIVSEADISSVNPLQVVNSSPLE